MGDKIRHFVAIQYVGYDSEGLGADLPAAGSDGIWKLGVFYILFFKK